MTGEHGGDPLRVGRGLVSGSGDPAEHTLTSLGAGERIIPEPEPGSEHDEHRSLDVPSGLQPDIMENHEERNG